MRYTRIANIKENVETIAAYAAMTAVVIDPGVNKAPHSCTSGIL
jgi:hypothetical protein